MQRKRLLAYAAMYLLWGGSYLAIRCVVSAVPPLLAAGIRYLLAGLVIWAICEWGPRSGWPSYVQTRNAMLSGIALLGLIYASVYWAETRMSSWLAGALYATSFLWAYLAECAAERRIPRSAIVLPILIGLAAIPLMLEPRSASRQELLPAMVVLVSAMLWSVMLVVLKRIQLPRNYRQTAALQLLAAGPFLIMVSRLSGEWLRVTHAWSFFAWKPIVGMIYLVFGASLISFSAFHWLLRHDRPSMVASSAYVNPVVALASGVLILHEECRPLQAAGAFLLVGSIATVWMLRESEAIRSIWKRYKLRASQNVSTSDCDVLAVTQPAVEEG